MHFRKLSYDAPLTGLRGWYHTDHKMLLLLLLLCCGSIFTFGQSTPISGGSQQASSGKTSLSA